MKKLLLALLMTFGLLTGVAASEAGIHWDKFPSEKMEDKIGRAHV